MLLPATPLLIRCRHDFAELDTAESTVIAALTLRCLLRYCCHAGATRYVTGRRLRYARRHWRDGGEPKNGRTCALCAPQRTRSILARMSVNRDVYRAQADVRGSVGVSGE